MFPPLMKVNVYIDGFNLYYGAVKGTPYRWLNVAEMCRLLLPRDQILQMKYFTALVNPRRSDPDQRSRQETFLRALATIPNLSIVYGFFLTHEIMMPLALPAKGYKKVIKTEEKGSDVNLATHLLIDALSKLRNRRYHREPLSKALGNGLFELRHVGKLNTRVLWFFAKGQRIIAVHAIRNKGQAVSAHDVQTARERMNDWRKRIKQ